MTTSHVARDVAHSRTFRSKREAGILSPTYACHAASAGRPLKRVMIRARSSNTLALSQRNHHDGLKGMTVVHEAVLEATFEMNRPGDPAAH